MILFGLFQSGGATAWSPHPGLAFFPLVIGLAILGDFVYSFLLGLTSLWWVENFGLYAVAGNLAFVLTGSLLPLDFFPPWLRNLIMLLPFPHLIYSPVRLILGLSNFNDLLFSAVVLTIWILILGLTVRWLWPKGLRAYEGIGL